jgi:hypothetical protein
MTDANDTSTRTASPRRPRFDLHEEIAEQITGHLMRYRSFSDPETWRRFSIARIRAALDAARRR